MKGRSILLYCFLMCIATGIVVHVIEDRQQKKIAVVDAIKVFDQFNMKKELEGHAKVRLQQISKRTDSVGNKLQLAYATKNADEIKQLTEAYNYLKTSLDNEYQKSNQDINEQVWKRLNPIFDEYGKMKGLHLIIGANGAGTVLYNDDHYDQTDDVIKYINKKYEEGN